MVATPPAGETLRQIAGRHGRTYETLRRDWSRHPAWPAPIGTGRAGAHLYDPAAVDAVIAEHFARPVVELEPSRLYTAAEIEKATGINRITIRVDVKHDRWPAADDTSQRAHRWYGATVNQTLASRRAYRRGGE